MKRNNVMCLVITAFFCACVPFSEGAEKAIDLSANPQLFLDDYLVARMDNIKRDIQQPDRHPANPLIVPDKPWEKIYIEVYGTVLYDPQVQKFRCWYLAKGSETGIPDTPEAPGTAEYYQCYAESEDGITWTKPMVGKRYGRYAKNNIVIPIAHGFCVLPTPDDPYLAKRYRGIGGKTLGFSPDGIQWDTKTEAAKNWSRAVGKNDTSSCVVRWKDKYLAYVRYQAPETDVYDEDTGLTWRSVMRSVGLCVSKDFVHWTPKQMVFKTDKKDGYPWTQAYGMSVTPYGDVLIGLVPMLHLVPKSGNNGVGPMDVELVVSRDGRKWNRVADRGVFMASGKIVKGEKAPWDLTPFFPTAPMFIKDDTVYVYYTGINVWHGVLKGRKVAIGLATLPADRFVALCREKTGQEGVLQTKLLEINGSDLLVNAELSNKTDLKVELLDTKGDVLNGFERDQSRLVVHDKLRYRVVWGSEEIQKAIKDVEGQALAIRFVLSDGQLYAFQIVK